MRFTLIRHGKTPGNIKRIYLGRTDEPLSTESANEIAKRSFPKAELLFVSPMLRCRQTADLIYPDMEQIVINDLREYDFGDFEGKTHEELEHNPLYISWIASNAMKGVPGGEDGVSFAKRCVSAFLEIADISNGKNNISIVCHGGTIMAVINHFVASKNGFYSWQAENLEGYSFKWNSENSLITEISGFTGK